MAADDSRAHADIAALEHELPLLGAIRDGLASQAATDVMVDAVTSLIAERQAELERARSLS